MVGVVVRDEHLLKTHMTRVEGLVLIPSGKKKRNMVAIVPERRKKNMCGILDSITGIEVSS